MTIKTCILVLGAESSGTRFVAGLMSQHPQIAGMGNTHSDLLNEFWKNGDENTLEEAFLKNDVILTRRSIPSGVENNAARFLQFDSYDRLSDFCHEKGYVLKVVITTRSPYANIASWSRSRVSPGQSAAMAEKQYQQAYKHIFRWLLDREEIEYWIVSIEGFLHESSYYLNALFCKLGLSKTEAVTVDPDPAINFRHYIRNEQFGDDYYQLPVKFEFGRGHESIKFCSEGWSMPEPGHVWNISENASLSIPVDLDDCSDINVVMKIKVLVVKGTVDFQKIDVIIDRKVIARQQLAANGLVQFVIPNELTIQGRQLLVIKFYNPTTVIPAGLFPGNNDKRKLGFAVCELDMSKG